eukprot:TRINITY_DN1963_c0_g1_i4.p1 TRINITY_DN1963_c0_g1~~TRINITY_DN1963_c0_g1_i4.p1  ORF type:complete len:817 (-),score=136.88 TRINITY_DN1963_c0_g1_i4:849-3299(-)
MEEYLTEVLVMVVLYCNTILARLDLMLAQKSCPVDLKEACCGIVYAAPYLDEQLELMKARAMIMAKYGKKFPNECVDCACVNPKVVSRLNRSPPNSALVQYYISAIGSDNNVPGYNLPNVVPDDLPVNANMDTPTQALVFIQPPVQMLPPTLPAAPLQQVLQTDPAHCVARGPGLVDGVAGVESTFLIQAKDQTGAPRPCGGDKFFAYVSGPANTRIYGTVSDNENGTYFVTYTPPLSGAYAIAVHLNQTPIGNKQPYNLFVREPEKHTDPRFCKADGDGLRGGKKQVESVFTITACDSTGQKRPCGGDQFNVFIAGPNDLKMCGTVLDNGDGTYTCTYTPPHAGAYAAAIYLDKTPIGDGTPFQFTVADTMPVDDLASRLQRLKTAEPQPKQPPVPGARPVRVQVPQPIPTGSTSSATASLPADLLPVAIKKSSLVPSQLGPAIVFDNGTGMVKAGIAGDPLPRCMVPTVVGRPMFQSVNFMLTPAHLFVGDEAIRKRGILALRYPIAHGIISDYNDMEAIWNHTFLNELRVDPKGQPVLVTEPASNPAANRVKLAEIMFEKIGVPGLYICSQALLSLLASGKRTGIVLDAGDGVCHSVPVVEGKPVRHATNRLEMGGRDLTTYLIKLLTEDNVFLSSTSSERDIGREIKEKLGYVASDYAAELAKAPTQVVADFRMPDQELVRITKARFMCSEPLFEPVLLGKDTAGCAQMIYESLNLCDPKDKPALLGNVVLAGGSSMFSGFRVRVEQDLRRLLDPQTEAPLLHVHAPDNRKVSVWCGGSQLAAHHETFCGLCVSRDEYMEHGASCLAKFDSL